MKHESFTAALLNGFEPVDEIVQTFADIRGDDFDALARSPGDGFGGTFQTVLDAAFCWRAIEHDETVCAANEVPVLCCEPGLGFHLAITGEDFTGETEQGRQAGSEPGRRGNDVSVL